MNGAMVLPAANLATLLVVAALLWWRMAVVEREVRGLREWRHRVEQDVSALLVKVFGERRTRGRRDDGD